MQLGLDVLLRVLRHNRSKRHRLDKSFQLFARSTCCPRIDITIDIEYR